MDLGIRGKTALVLGASRGLGFGIAEALAMEGVDLVIVSRDAAKLDAAAERLRQAAGVKVIAHAADLTSPTAPSQIAAAALAGGRTIDILVNNTGGPPAMPLRDAGEEVWRQQFQTMVASVITLTNALLPGMRSRGWGRIITVVSSGVVQPIERLGLSNSLRAALVGWSKTLSQEIARDGVTVNCLAPGRIQTDRVDELDGAAARSRGVPVETVAEQSRQTIPIGRYGTAAEFGAVAAFLAGVPAAYMTGGVVRVDGGMIRSV